MESLLPSFGIHMHILFTKKIVSPGSREEEKTELQWLCILSHILLWCQFQLIFPTRCPIECLYHPVKESESEVAQLCLTLCDPMDCSLPGSSVHGIFQATVLEWIAISFSRGSSQPRNRTRVSHIVDRRFTIWATREVLISHKSPFNLQYRVTTTLYKFFQKIRTLLCIGFNHAPQTNSRNDI